MRIRDNGWVTRKFYGSTEIVRLKHDRSMNKARPSRMLQAMAYAPVSSKEKQRVSSSA